MSATWAERNEAWEARAKLLGERAVLHVGHKTPEAQAEILAKQRAAILPRLREALAPLVQEIRRTPIILDFGCGVGRWTSDLNDLGMVVGIDPTERFLAICREKHPRGEFKLYQDGKIPEEDSTFDVVFACMVLSTILDVSGGMYEATLREIKRVLRPGGLMLLVDNTEGRGGRPVRSPYSISRTVKEYQDSFVAHNIVLAVLGSYEDLGETNTIFAGRRVL